MNQENRLPKEVRLAGIRLSGTREATEHRLGGPQQQAGVKKLLDNSPLFTDLTKAVKQAMQDQKKGRPSHILAPWDETAGKYWVVRQDDPNYRFLSFSGLRGVVPAAMVDVAWDAIATDEIEEA